MLTATMRVEGGRELAAELRLQRGEDALKACISANAAGIQVFKKGAIEILRSSPSVDTELLLRNVVAKKVPRSQSTATAEHIVTVRKRFYPRAPNGDRKNTKQVAIYTEFGTVKQQSESFLRKSFDTRKERAIAAVVARLKQRIRKLNAR